MRSSISVGSLGLATMVAVIQAADIVYVTELEIYTLLVRP
jgi:hypothetical protein